MTLEVCNKARFEELINSGDTVLVDFFATWCGPCKAMAPILEDVADGLEAGKKIVKVDIDQERELAIKSGVMAVPTLIVFKDGKIVKRTVGLQDRDAVIELLN